jgi:hypothetical protein
MSAITPITDNRWAERYDRAAPEKRMGYATFSVK